MFLSEGEYNREGNKLTSVRQRYWKLPEGLIWSDFSSEENLLELEDLTTGERPWFRTIDLLKKDLRVGHEYQMLRKDGSALIVRFEGVTAEQFRKKCYLLPVFEIIGQSEKYIHVPGYPKGICKMCGCSEDNACHNHSVGNCYWVDESETLCSHCSNPSLRTDPLTLRPILK